MLLYLIGDRATFFVRDVYSVVARGVDLARGGERVALTMSATHHSLNGARMSDLRIVAWSVRTETPPPSMSTRKPRRYRETMGDLSVMRCAQRVNMSMNTTQNKIPVLSDISYNIWNYQDGILFYHDDANWLRRKVLIAGVIRNALPDIIGIQVQRRFPCVVVDIELTFARVVRLGIATEFNNAKPQKPGF